MSSFFDLPEFLARSRALDLSGIDWAAARRTPLTAAESRLLPYFIDVEAYTILYLKTLLSTSAAADPDICDFLACWLYEESYHGRAIERVLEAAGTPLTAGRPKSVQRPAGALESLRDLAAGVLSRVVGDDFVAVLMTWGAIQELTTLHGYRRVADKTANPVLDEVIRRIMRDESRHFGFYYQQAETRLARSPRARRLTRWLIDRFWKPVGAGIMPDPDVDFLTAYLFGDPGGLAEASRVDEAIARLPGLEGWRGLTAFTEGALERTAVRQPRGEAVLV